MRKASLLFSSFLRQFAADDKSALICLQEMWSQIVGAEMARWTRPSRLSSHRLEIRVENRVWENQLREMRFLIKESINRTWGMPLVEQIRLKRKQGLAGEE